MPPSKLAMLALAVGGSIACSRTQPGLEHSVPSASVPLDRLSDAEVMPDEAEAMGIQFPRGMRIAARYPRSVLLTGTVSADELADVVRKQVLSSHVELAPGKTIFAKVFVRGDKSKTPYRIDITRGKRGAEVRIVDLTVSPHASTLKKLPDDAARWKKAGRNPDGTLLDPMQME